MSDRSGSNVAGGTGAVGAIARGLAVTIRLWAILGGLAASALALMTAASAVSNVLFAAPFAADYELVKHGIAVVIFMFLPYCQLAGANVTVDIFTEGMGERSKAAMAMFASIFAIVFAALLLRQMSLGFLDYREYVEVTPVLKLPLWTAFPPILVSLALLLVAAVLTLTDGARSAAGHPSWFATVAHPEDDAA